MTDDRTAKARELLDNDITEAINTIRSAAQLLDHADLDSPGTLAVQGLLATASGALVQAGNVLLDARQRAALAAAKGRGEPS